MIRLVALLMAWLLPLQFVWGGMAVYCQHEPANVAAAHAGHHEHVHHADGKPASDQSASSKSPSATLLAGDTDCGTCHATGSVVASEATEAPAAGVAVRRLVFADDPTPASALARAPDRPQWPCLA